MSQEFQFSRALCKNLLLLFIGMLTAFGCSSKTTCHCQDHAGQGSVDSRITKDEELRIYHLGYMRGRSDEKKMHLESHPRND